MSYLKQAIDNLTGMGPAILADLRTVAHPGPRMIDEMECVVSVLLAIVFAHALGAQNVGWAAFSGYAVMRSQFSESLTRGTLRILGTAAGAAVALAIAPWTMRSPLALSAVLALIGGITLYFALV